jgi:hypothetical protein
MAVVLRNAELALFASMASQFALVQFQCLLLVMPKLPLLKHSLKTIPIQFSKLGLHLMYLSAVIANQVKSWQRPLF